MDVDTGAEAAAVAAFDLESYISRYDKSSETKVQRLLFIAKHSEDEDVIKSCFEMIGKHCRDNGNIKRYKEVFGAREGGEGDTSETAHPSAYGFHYDAAYINATESSSAIQLETLEARLKQTLTHMNKASIRVAYTELALLHKNRGELREALHKIKRSQDYCTTSAQSGTACLHIIQLSIDSRHYNDARAYISKAEHTPDLLSADPLFASKLRAASALVSLSESKYADAAIKFSSISSDLTNQFSSVISAEDIALYGSVLALASLDRQNLQTLTNNFKGRLELVPPLRDALRHYVRAEYGQCLSLLSTVLPDMRLDIHLAKHVDALYGLIRDRCIVQYFLPYSIASITVMAKVFHIDENDMEDMLARLIAEGRLPGRPRIDSLKKVIKTERVVCTERRKRREVERKVKMMGERFVKETEGMILRLSCLEHGLVVQGDNRQGGWRGQRYAGGPGGGGGGGGRQRSRSGGSYDQGGHGAGAAMYNMDDSSDDSMGGINDAEMMDMEAYGEINPEDV